MATRPVSIGQTIPRLRCSSKATVVHHLRCPMPVDAIQQKGVPADRERLGRMVGIVVDRLVLFRQTVPAVVGLQRQPWVRETMEPRLEVAVVLERVEMETQKVLPV